MNSNNNINWCNEEAEQVTFDSIKVVLVFSSLQRREVGGR